MAAHYLTLLVFQGQAIVFLASDPLGNGSDIFGTAGRSIDYSVLSSNATWYLQVAFVVIRARHRAHAGPRPGARHLRQDASLAVRSQYWMLVIMVGFTSLALLLLSQSNQ